MSPAVSPKQQRFMAAELGRLRRGKRTRTGMSADQLEDYVREPIKPKRQPAAKRKK